MKVVRAIGDRRGDDGASAVEYALLLAGIAAVVVAAVFLFGAMVHGLFSGSCTTITTTTSAHGSTTSTCS